MMVPGTSMGAVVEQDGGDWREQGGRASWSVGLGTWQVWLASEIVSSWEEVGRARAGESVSGRPRGAGQSGEWGEVGGG